MPVEGTPTSESRFTPGFAPECMACPIGLVFFAIRTTRPEAMEHLMKAGYELFQAFRSVMDGYAERWDQANAQKIQRITID
jgi:hypothetical protein